MNGHKQGSEMTVYFSLVLIIFSSTYVYKIHSLLVQSNKAIVFFIWKYFR